VCKISSTLVSPRAVVNTRATVPDGLGVALSRGWPWLHVCTSSSTMPVSLSLDVGEDVWTLHQTGTSLLDGASFAEWRADFLGAISKVGHAIDLLVDLDEVTLHPSVALAFALVICRTPSIREAVYFNADVSTKAALKLAHPYVRLQPDRAQALAALDSSHADRAVVRKSGTVARVTVDAVRKAR